MDHLKESVKTGMEERRGEGRDGSKGLAEKEGGREGDGRTNVGTWRREIGMDGVRD